LILTPKEKGTDGAIIKAHKLFNNEPDKYWMPNQFKNPVNPEVHYQTTAQEIINDLPDITHFVAGLGTSGTVMGVGRRLKEYKRDIQIIAAEPVLGHKVQGLKNMQEAIVPDIYDESVFGEKISVPDELVYQTVRQVIRQEGIFLGMSSGAALRVALDLAQKLTHGNIAIISPDRGEKYLSTALFS
jgi:cysteine synthase